MPNNVDLVLRQQNSKRQKVQGAAATRKLRSKLPRQRRVPLFEFRPPLSTEAFEVARAEASASCSSDHFQSEISFNSSAIVVRPEKRKRIGRNPGERRENRVVLASNAGSEAEDTRIRTRSYYKRMKNFRTEVERGTEAGQVDLSDSSCVETFCKGRERIFGKFQVLIGEEAGMTVPKVVDPVLQKNASNVSGKNMSPEAYWHLMSKSYKSADHSRQVGEIVTFGAESLATSFLESVSALKGSRELLQSGNSAKTESEYDESMADTNPDNMFEYDSELACSENLISAEGSGYETCEEPTLSEIESDVFSSTPNPDLYLSSPSSTEIFRTPGAKSVRSACFALFLQYTEHFLTLSTFPETRIQKEYTDEFILLRLEEEELEESYKMFRSWERNHEVPRDYTEAYRSIPDNGEMVLRQRLLMVHWIIEYSAMKRLQSETLFLSVSLLDRFLCKGYFESKRHLQLLGIACCTLATRIEENQPFNKVRQLQFQAGCFTYTRCEVVAMEWVVQQVLNFRCFSPTVSNFMRFYLTAANADKVVERGARYLASLSLLDRGRLCFWPSTVAAGLVILASLAADREASCHRVMEIHVRTKTDDLPECIQSLEWLVKYIC